MYNGWIGAPGRMGRFKPERPARVPPRSSPRSRPSSIRCPARRSRSSGEAAARIWRGSVLEIVADQKGGTWRAVYTVRYPEAVYVLHAFQKKSKSGISTPKRDMDLIYRRLAEAERLHRERQN